MNTPTSNSEQRVFMSAIPFGCNCVLLIMALVAFMFGATLAAQAPPSTDLRDLITLARQARTESGGSPAEAIKIFRRLTGDGQGEGATGYGSQYLMLAGGPPRIVIATHRDRLRTVLYSRLLNLEPLTATDPYSGTCVIIFESDATDVARIALVKDGTVVPPLHNGLVKQRGTSSGAVCWPLSAFRPTKQFRLVVYRASGKPVEAEIPLEYMLPFSAALGTASTAADDDKPAITTPTMAAPPRRDPALGVTARAFSRISTGMTYAEVISLIGEVGEEASRVELGDVETVMYMWKNRDGSNMNAMFQNGKLVSKAQAGLK
jgi:hypothetical protein